MKYNAVFGIVFVLVFLIGNNLKPDLAIDQEVMLDIFARVGWNPFVYVNPPSGTNIDVVPVRDSWVISAGVLIHTSPILHE